MSILTLLNLNEQVEVNDLQISVNHLRVIFDHFCCELNIKIRSLIILTGHTHVVIQFSRIIKKIPLRTVRCIRHVKVLDLNKTTNIYK